MSFNQSLSRGKSEAAQEGTLTSNNRVSKKDIRISAARRRIEDIREQMALSRELGVGVSADELDFD
ncbi:PA3496 family putative envelope integrity protein [Shewanella indica]|uniref:PA3496 family putative envelope integrity protein n=1 Tax=Shewanella TaxID=22 RepID=UPI000B8B8078|nr:MULTISPECIES: hypothetical protein [Shewanella]OXS00768.1 hypothetical protein AMR44_11255 [Shewanella algae]PSS71188.1 hypothetical protein AYI85_01975 [Shewanella algae]TVL04363.1 hypothetical protein AYI84_07950 [Shewanella algae]TVL49529.1 hypothetical protein AYI99_19625 [Shewanella algae]GHA99831.1 hypothetical protein GCM10007107_11020 [Shewanella indica]